MTSEKTKREFKEVKVEENVYLSEYWKKMAKGMFINTKWTEMS